MKRNWSMLFGLAILTASVAVGCQSGNPFNFWGGPPPNPYATQAPFQQAAPGGYGAAQPYGSDPSYGAPSYGAPSYGAPSGGSLSGYNGSGSSEQPVGSGSAPAGGNMGSGSY